MNSKKLDRDEIIEILKKEYIKKGRILLCREIDAHPLLPSRKAVRRAIGQSFAEFYKSLPISKSQPACRFCQSRNTTFITAVIDGRGRYECNECQKKILLSVS